MLDELRVDLSLGTTDVAIEGGAHDGGAIVAEFFVGDVGQIDAELFGEFGDDDFDVEVFAEAEPIGDVGVESVDAGEHADGQGGEEIAGGHGEDFVVAEGDGEVDLSEEQVESVNVLSQEPDGDERGGRGEPEDAVEHRLVVGHGRERIGGHRAEMVSGPLGRLKVRWMLA